MSQLHFTSEANGVLSRAEVIASYNGDTELRDDHLLLGILEQAEGIGAVALSELGVTKQTAQEATKLHVPEADNEPLYPVPRSAEAKETIIRAAKVAMGRFGTHGIKPEHVLLGIARDPETPVGQLLTFPTEDVVQATDFEKMKLVVTTQGPDPLEESVISTWKATRESESGKTT
jgi:ATP-dependent Clp protease ATP-binding subunit ClpA